MPRAPLPISLIGFCLPTFATDVTLFTGYQYNSNVEIVSANELPPVVEPNTGEPGDDVELDDSAAFSLAVDFVFEQQPTKRIGFYVSHQQTEFDSKAGLTNTDIDITHLHFTAMSYYPQDRLEPFILAGIGAGFFSPQDSTLEDETNFSAQVGAGTNYRLPTACCCALTCAGWLPFSTAMAPRSAVAAA